jgi:1-acyl-sn-glycerol-3-phosphate acyltransferase
LPVTRRDGEQLLTAASAKLAAGWSVALCPEGKLNHGGPLFRGQTGAVRLALRSRAPLVPLGLYVAPHDLIDMHGTRHGRPCRGRVQVGGVCYVNLGRPWWPAPVPPSSDTGAYLRQATNDLMDRIEVQVQLAAARCDA